MLYAHGKFVTSEETEREMEVQVKFMQEQRQQAFLCSTKLLFRKFFIFVSSPNSLSSRECVKLIVWAELNWIAIKRQWSCANVENEEMCELNVRWIIRWTYNWDVDELVRSFTRLFLCCPNIKSLAQWSRVFFLRLFFFWIKITRFSHFYFTFCTILVGSAVRWTQL